MPEVSNYWFAIYYLYYKEKLEIIKFIYNLYFLYRSDSLRIVKMQANDKLINDNIFTNNKKKIIKIIKIMI